MLKKLVAGLDVETFLLILSVSGGLGRLAIVGPEKGTSVWAEIGRIICVAAPLGIMAGMYVDTLTLNTVLPFFSCFATGYLSLNIARFILTKKGVMTLLQAIVGRIK